MAAGGVSLATQLAVLSSVINSAILSVLLTGIYTTVYFAAIYLYLTRQSKASRSATVLGAVTMLYTINIVTTAVQWRALQAFLELDGEPTEVFFAAAIAGFGWQDIVGNVMNLMLSPIADALLIWHCYKLWDSALRVVVPSLVLLLAQVALYLAVLIADRAPTNPAFTRGDPTNRLFAAALAATALNTALTALLIARRTPRNHTARHRTVRTIKHALEALAQSAGVLAPCAALYAAAVALPLSGANARVLVCMAAYTGVVFVFLAGMAPTLMVVRAACASPTAGPAKSRSHLSDLEFRAQSLGVSALSGHSSIQVQLRTADAGDRASLDDVNEKAPKSAERMAM
ncbi:hypothetical protein HYPSUDRAFT_41134 [Hypholoma sublateritium FD-334 SS-4]|uniref:Uncharacterized protein n=1 Tax=Hypholoma sublateritium (strain FD-334 SS-4) TaxID=945553 RepID=A0A0D2PQX3_HYPSF|nr:hypothetical protein HYPSUDRAFT_41134 [Hypholoma sublateritium FD-334 SS-4]